MSKDDMVEYLTVLVWSGLSGAGLDRLQPTDVLSDPLAAPEPEPSTAS
jgi:hypothetical protein